MALPTLSSTLRRAGACRLSDACSASLIWHQAHTQVETELELSFVMEAEMVFTTLSSTGRRVFQRLPPEAFETVLIDEAAQASEIAALQPLTFGSKR